MKKTLILTLVPLFTTTGDYSLTDYTYENDKQVLMELNRKDLPDLTPDEHLVTALILVESRGNDSAIGDRHLVGEEAVGALQIRPIMVREVNRILKIQKSDKRFKLKDRYDRQKTLEMFYIWKDYHHSDSDYETIARNWNGGPRGYKRNSTLRYWRKVQKELDGITNR